MTVSIVIPMRNGEPFIRQTLESILSQSGPTGEPIDLEVVVVNDGSTDGSETTVADIAQADPRVRMIDGPQQGIAPSLNAGINAATGDYLVRCDADDLLPPHRLAAQLDYLTKHPEALAVCGTYATISDKGKPLSSLDTGADPADITDELHAGDTRTHFGTYMTRTSALNELGGARPYFNGVEDVDLQLRLATLGPVHYQPLDCYRYRLHGTSSTHTQPSPQRIFLTDTARAFARQRAGTGADDLMRGNPPDVPQDHAPGVDVREQAQGMLMGEAWRHFRAGHRGKGIAIMWRAALARPAHPAGWTSLLQILVKKRRCAIQPLTKAPGTSAPAEPSHG
ncbi:MAG: glycosyltransferase family A protein [Planctomycetota bacterium]